MARHAIRLADGRTVLELDDETGCLWERSPAYDLFHRPAVDTWALLHLLTAHETEIKSAYTREVGAAKAGLLPPLDIHYTGETTEHSPDEHQK